MKNYDYAKLAKGARREQGMRKSVFGKKVAAGTMTVEAATEMTDQMGDIAEILESLAEFKSQQLPAGGAELIALERAQHTKRENYDAAHDDAHDTGEIAKAGIAYIFGALADVVPQVGNHDPEYMKQSATNWWPWHRSYYKTHDKAIRKLVKAGALIAAEIDRLLRKNAKIRAEREQAVA